MKTLNFEQMEQVEGGMSKGTLCAGLAVGALGCAIGSIFSLGASAELSVMCIGLWLDKCAEGLTKSY